MCGKAGLLSLLLPWRCMRAMRLVLLAQGLLILLCWSSPSSVKSSYAAVLSAREP